MKDKRRWIFRACALLVILAVAGAMMIIGRGHTVYFDNKAIEVNGQMLPSFHKVVVRVKGEKVATLKDKDRGMADTMGGTFSMDLEITKEEGGETQTSRVTMPIPYGLDGVVVNIPALMAGLPQDAYMSEFVIQEPEDSSADEEIVTDELDNIGGDL